MKNVQELVLLGSIHRKLVKQKIPANHVQLTPFPTKKVWQSAKIVDRVPKVLKVLFVAIK